MNGAVVGQQSYGSTGYQSLGQQQEVFEEVNNFEYFEG